MDRWLSRTQSLTNFRKVFPPFEKLDRTKAKRGEYRAGGRGRVAQCDPDEKEQEQHEGRPRSPCVRQAPEPLRALVPVTVAVGRHFRNKRHINFSGQGGQRWLKSLGGHSGTGLKLDPANVGGPRGQGSCGPGEGHMGAWGGGGVRGNRSCAGRH